MLQCLNDRLPVAVLVLFVLIAHAGQTADAQPAGVVGQRVSCVAGTAAGFSCSEADLLSVLTPAGLGAGMRCFSGNSQVPRLCKLNDMWGWADPLTGFEYALVGREDGTAFVDVTDPVNPVYVGELLPYERLSGIWRDIKVYGTHAYIVAESSGGQGLQIFDLTQLRNVEEAPVTFATTAVYTLFDRAHNIAINQETGFAYAVGIGSGQPACGGGLHMIDLSDPVSPQFAGCFAHVGTGRSGSGYTHDVQCVVYRGPDSEFRGREICFGANETHISVADVTDKQNPIAISKATYADSRYIHQGWLTEDYRYFIQNDEGDESGGVTSRTRTLFWDVTDLRNPILIKEYFSTESSTDHNLYVKGNFVFQSNYIDGLRILDITDIENPVQVAYFDTHPDNLGRFEGSWSNYPFFESGAVGVTSSVDGFFMIAPTAAGMQVATESDELPSESVVTSAWPNPFSDRMTISVTVPRTQYLRIEIYDMLGRKIRAVFGGTVSAGSGRSIELEADDLPGGNYYYRITGEDFSISKQITRVH